MPSAVWDSTGHLAPGGVFLDDPQVLHVLGELGLQHQAANLRWAGWVGENINMHYYKIHCVYPVLLLHKPAKMYNILYMIMKCIFVTIATLLCVYNGLWVSLHSFIYIDAHFNMFWHSRDYLITPVCFSAAFHAYGKPFKAVVETRWVWFYRQLGLIAALSDKPHSNEKEGRSGSWPNRSISSFSLAVSLQHDRPDVGNLHCLLCRHRWPGLQFLCAALGFTGLAESSLLWLLFNENNPRYKRTMCVNHLFPHIHTRGAHTRLISHEAKSRNES